MLNRKIIIPSSIIMLMLGALNLPVQSSTKNPGALHATHVNWISLKKGKVDNLKVSAKGAKYDTVLSKNYKAQYSASVKCKGAYRVNYFEVSLHGALNIMDIIKKKNAHNPLGMYNDSIVKWRKKSGKKYINAANRTLTGPFTNKAKNAALASCNDKAKQVAQQQGISLAKAMSIPQIIKLKSDDVYIPYSRLGVVAACGSPPKKIPNNIQYLNARALLQHQVASPTVKVECLAKPYRKPAVTKPLPLDTAMQITKLQLSSNVKKFTGSCPKKVKLTAEITTNKAGTVMYQWKAGNAKSLAKKLVFAKGQKRTISRTINVSNSGKKTYTLITKSPKTKNSNPVTVDIKCVYPQ